MITLSYKTFEATAAFDADAGIFHGEVSNLRDVITFQAKSVADLQDTLADSVEDYLAFCGEGTE